MFSVITRAIAFLFKIYLSRKLGAEAVGLYQICLSVFFTLAAFSCSGIPLILSRRIAALPSADRKISASYISASLAVSVSTALITVGVFLLFRQSFSVLFKDERAMPLFTIMLPALVTSAVYCVFRAWLLGKRDYLTYSVTELAEEVIRALLSIFLASGIISSLAGATGIAAAFTVSDVICAVMLIAIYAKKKGGVAAPSSAGLLIKESLPVTLMRLFSGLITSLTAIVIPMRLVSAGMDIYQATAEYGRVAGMALPLLMAPTTLTGSLSVVLVPEIADRAQKQHELTAKITSSLLFLTIIASAFCMLYVPMGESITVLLFNDAPSGRFVSLAAVLIFPMGLNQLSASMLNSLGMEKRTFFHYLAGASLLLLSIVFTPKFIGIYSIALGFILSFTLTSILNIRLLYKKCRFEIPAKKIAFSVLCAVPSAVFCRFLLGIVSAFAPDIISVPFAAAGAIGMYVVFTQLTGVTDYKTAFVNLNAARILKRKARMF